jgi:transmembrane sensor
MDTKQAEALIQKYLDGTASPEEQAIFESWYNQSVHHSSDPMIEPDYKALQQRLAKSLPAGNQQTYKLWPRIAVAAAAVAVITLSVWIYTNGPDVKSGDVVVNDIAPGKNGATITLANGKVIQLSDSKTGVVIGDDDLKYDDNTLVIQSDSEGSRFPDGSGQALGTRNDKGGEDVVEMTATTAKGQTYQFTLPDGTKVWLNADSKLEFPSNFVNSKTRNVKLSGEGYFEVAKDKAHPFIVATDKQEVEVLGTHFNINAYKDESNTKTTLLEGSVSVRHAEFISASRNSKAALQGRGPDLRQDDTETSSARAVRFKQDGEAIVLKPNQQSILTGSNQLAVTDIDPEAAVAWKNNKFMFDSQSITDIMRMVSRWYNVEVIYTGELPTDKFWGSVSRFDNVSKVLKALESTNNVHFKIEGRRIYVLR